MKDRAVFDCMVYLQAVIKAVCDARRRISESVAHDPRKLVEHCRQMQKRHREKLVSQPRQRVSLRQLFCSTRSFSRRLLAVRPRYDPQAVADPFQRLLQCLQR